MPVPPAQATILLIAKWANPSVEPVLAFRPSSSQALPAATRGFSTREHKVHIPPPA